MQKTKELAIKQAYLSGMTYKEISKEYGIGIAALCRRVVDNKWAVERKNIQQKAVEITVDDYARMIQKAKIDVSKRHIDITKMVDKTIKAKLKQSTNGDKTILEPDEIANLARALKASADVSHKVVGITDEIQAGTNIFQGPVQVNINPVQQQEEKVIEAVYDDFPEPEEGDDDDSAADSDGTDDGKDPF